MEVSSSGQGSRRVIFHQNTVKVTFNTSCELFWVIARGSHAYIVRKLEY